MKKASAYFFFSVFFPWLLGAQRPILGHPDWYIKPAYNQCFIMVHRANVAHLVQGYPSVFEMNVAKPTLGNKLWQLENNLPVLGISFQYIAFKNPAELGAAYTLAPYVEIPLNQVNKPSRLFMRLCWGVSYLSKDFDMTENHKNVAIGSKWNAYVQFKWFWQIPISKYMQFEPGFTFNHASNGKIQNPNLGLNLMGISAALNFRIPGKTKVEFTKVDSSTKVRSKYELLSFIAAGMNERSIEGEQLGTFVFSTALQRNIRNTHKFSLGLDFYFDENYQTDYLNVFGEEASGLEQWRISLRGGYSYNVGRLSFPIEVGYYIYQKTNPDAMLVSRIGLRYYFKNGLVAHWGLRTHYAVAYNFEFGIGYRFCLHAK